MFELLGCDRETWRQVRTDEAYFPCAVGDERVAGRVARLSEATLGATQLILGDLKDMHFEAWDGPTECRDCLQNGLGAPYILWWIFGLTAPLDAWLARDDDRRADYAFYKAQLGAIKVANDDLSAPDPRDWLLKDPCHLFSLDALFEHFPRATVVNLHRDPVAVAGSLCSLCSNIWKYTHRTDSNTAPAPPWRAKVVEYLAKMLDAGLAYRDRTPDAKVIDLTMNTLVDDPIAAVQNIYDFAGKPLTKKAREAMLDYIAANKDERKASKHAYALADYGLDADDINKRFASYKATYGV